MISPLRESSSSRLHIDHDLVRVQQVDSGRSKGQFGWCPRARAEPVLGHHSRQTQFDGLIGETHPHTIAWPQAEGQEGIGDETIPVLGHESIGLIEFGHWIVLRVHVDSVGRYFDGGLPFQFNATKDVALFGHSTSESYHWRVLA